MTMFKTFTVYLKNADGSIVALDRVRKEGAAISAVIGMRKRGIVAWYE